MIGSLQVSMDEFDPHDMDTYLFLTNFRGRVWDKVLEVGAHDAPVSNTLAKNGFRVYGVDLREYDKALPPCNYTYTREDFCDLPASFVGEHQGTFDIAISLSAIEHFGLGTYQEGNLHPYYDVIAMRKLYEMLRPGGIAYITVPTGGKFIQYDIHWRVYDRQSLRERIIQDFTVDRMIHVACTDIQVGDETRKRGQILTDADMDAYSGDPPHISTLLMLYKTTMKRIAPDGR